MELSIVPPSGRAQPRVPPPHCVQNRHTTGTPAAVPHESHWLQETTITYEKTFFHCHRDSGSIRSGARSDSTKHRPHAVFCCSPETSCESSPVGERRGGEAPGRAHGQYPQNVCGK